MPRQAGPERSHFGGEHGLISETQNGEVKYYWKCMYCGWKVGGKSFQNQKARVHLSGDATLKSGLIMELCEKAPGVFHAPTTHIIFIYVCIVHLHIIY